eukprot:TRINITY_DN3281_c0_g1_i1.p1 TRINITY_DN3281_c0_g1~~TRINITY_DN3281_c0_g1_i1.p1  ORF type:complete len:243 (-),score=41.05 TRINITY_DN3281_c0_g1_i1:33-761(-)
MGGAATHALIHLGYAIKTGNTKAVAEGLAYSFFAYDDQGDPESVFTEEEKDPLQIISEIYSDPVFDENVVITGYNPFQSTMTNIATNFSEHTLKYASYWKTDNLPTKEILDQLTNLAITAYYQQGSTEFFLLHGVTSIFAIHSILEFLEEEDQRKVLKCYWLMLIAVYIARGRPSLDRAESFSSEKYSDWDDVIAQALTLNDEHHVKLVQACKTFSVMYPEHAELWFNSAAETLFKGESHED